MSIILIRLQTADKSVKIAIMKKTVTPAEQPSFLHYP